MYLGRGCQCGHLEAQRREIYIQAWTPAGGREPQGVKTTVKTTWADRKTTSVEYPANYDGKDYPVEGSRDVDAVALTRMDDFTSAATLKHAGKEIGVARRVVSPDRKTMTITYKGINTRGDLVDNVAVYDRQ